MRTSKASIKLYCIAFTIFFEICAIGSAAALPNDDTTLTPTEQCAAACSTACNPSASSCLQANPNSVYTPSSTTADVTTPASCTCTCAMTGCDASKQDPNGTSKTIAVTCAETSDSEVTCSTSGSVCSVACTNQCQFLMYRLDCNAENSTPSLSNNVCGCTCQLKKCESNNSQNTTAISSCTADETGTSCTFSY